MTAMYMHNLFVAELRKPCKIVNSLCFMAKNVVMKGVDGEGLFKQFVAIYTSEFRYSI
jgi:hypothetical protein